MSATATNPARLRGFIADMTRLVEAAGDDEARILEEGERLLADLIAHDDWLPPAFAEPHPEHYQQYLLHCDPLERFSVVSFVWGAGQRTPVHDHTVWGLVGMLRGAETSTDYHPGTKGLRPGATAELRPGEVVKVSPRIGDVHAVANSYDHRSSISIHVYGGNIGAIARHVYDSETGARQDFVSGYSGTLQPNVWDRSAEVRAALG